MRTTQKNINLDHLRAISALLVFFSHVFQIFWLPIFGMDTWPHNVVHIISESAVLVFFVLSGYVISTSLSKNINRNGGRLKISEYCVNRISRIYPPFLFSIVIASLVFTIVKLFGLPGSAWSLTTSQDIYHAREYITLNISELLTALVLYKGLLEINGPLWSLYIEVKMYLFAGLATVIFFTGINSVLYKFLFLCILLIFIKMTFPLLEHLYYPIWWFIGVLFYITENYFSKVGSLVCFLVTLLLLAFINNERIYSTIFQLIIICSLFATALVYRLPENRTLINISSFSYTLYVSHFPLLLLAYSMFSFCIQLIGQSLVVRAIFSLLATYLILILARRFAVYVEDVAFFQRNVSLIIRKVLA